MWLHYVSHICFNRKYIKFVKYMINDLLVQYANVQVRLHCCWIGWLGGRKYERIYRKRMNGWCSEKTHKIFINIEQLNNCIWIEVIKVISCLLNHNCLFAFPYSFPFRKWLIVQVHTIEAALQSTLAANFLFHACGELFRLIEMWLVLVEYKNRRFIDRIRLTVTSTKSIWYFDRKFFFIRVMDI